MSNPQYSADPAARKFLSTVVASVYTESTDRTLYQDVDNSGARPNHRRMTDLNRQQVTDMLERSEAKVDARLANFDTSVKTGFADLRAEFAEMRAEMAKQTGEMRAEMANVRADSHKATTEVTRWVVGFGIAILGAIFAFAKVADKAPAPLAAAAQPVSHQQVPLVVAVPAGSTVLSAPQAQAVTPAQPAK